MIGFRKKRRESDAREKMERLEAAETELGVLQYRAYHALTTLEERRRRNHWREAIEQMIQGVT